MMEEMDVETKSTNQMQNNTLVGPKKQTPYLGQLCKKGMDWT